MHVARERGCPKAGHLYHKCVDEDDVAKRDSIEATRWEQIDIFVNENSHRSARRGQRSGEIPHPYRWRSSADALCKRRERYETYHHCERGQESTIFYQRKHVEGEDKTSTPTQESGSDNMSNGVFRIERGERYTLSLLAMLPEEFVREAIVRALPLICRRKDIVVRKMCYFCSQKV